jgi:hypothetical protein
MVVKWNERPNTEGGSALVNNAAGGKEVARKANSLPISDNTDCLFISYFQHHTVTTYLFYVITRYDVDAFPLLMYDSSKSNRIA